MPDETAACDHTVISTHDPINGWADKPVDEWDWNGQCFGCKVNGVQYHDERGFVPNAKR